jgi:NhaP-type Na+/H+ or K+/H+ antiporter
VLALTSEEMPEAFVAVNENLSASLQVITFFLFGSLVVTTGYDASSPALLAVIAFTLLVARPAAVLLSFVRSTLPIGQRVFVAWFGPKGDASMLFALLVLRSQAPDRTIVFDIASFVVLASIAAHGLTDTVGARRIEERLGEDIRPAPRPG